MRVPKRCLPPTPPPPPPPSLPSAQRHEEKKVSRRTNRAASNFDLQRSTEQPETRMAVDAMEIDTPPRVSTEKEERKRKSKNKDPSSPSKKRKATEKPSKSIPKDQTNTIPPATNDPDSPYSIAKATLYLPLSPISISATHALSSLQAEHLSPLLLTYYPPLKGVVLAYSQASISSVPPSSKPKKHSDNPEPLTMAKTANEYGVLYVYLTATFLVFRPKRGQTLEGWVNVQSEGFMGAVVLNLFSVGIESNRLPRDWKWIAPGGEDESDAPAADATTDDEESVSGKVPPGFDAEKERFQPAPLADELDVNVEDEEEENAAGYFQSVSGHRVRGNIKFRVVDVDVIQGSERDRGFLSIEGTMLSVEEENQLLQKETNGLAGQSSTSQRNSRVIPIHVAPANSAPVVDIELEPTEKSEKKDKKDKKEKKDKKDKKEKKEKKEKKSKSKDKSKDA